MTVQYRKILHEQKGWILQTPEGELILDGWSGAIWIAETRKKVREAAEDLRRRGTKTKSPIKVTLTIYADEKETPS